MVVGLSAVVVLFAVRHFLRRPKYDPKKRTYSIKEKQSVWSLENMIKATKALYEYQIAHHPGRRTNFINKYGGKPNKDKTLTSLKGSYR